MDFTHDPEQDAIRDGIARLCSAFPDDYWLECDREHRYPEEFFRALADGGWIGVALPPQYGGGGLGITEASLVLEQIAASGAAMSGCSTIHLPIFGLEPVVKHGSAYLRDCFLPRIVDGSLQVCFGVTEADAGSDTTRITTIARRQGDEYVVNGAKTWISNAQRADRVMLLVRTTPRDQCKRPTEGMTLLFAPMDPTRVQVRRIEKLGRNAIDSNEVFIDDLIVPVSDRVGEEGAGFKYLLAGLNAERILLAHEAIGIGEAALRRAVRYAGERVVFDRPIGSNQGIQLPLAEAATKLEAARLVAAKAAWLYDRGEPCGREANMAKVLAADAGFFAADRAVQTLGGLGYAREYHVERYFREARLMQLAPITQELALAYIGTKVLGLPRSY